MTVYCPWCASLFGKVFVHLSDMDLFIYHQEPVVIEIHLLPNSGPVPSPTRTDAPIQTGVSRLKDALIKIRNRKTKLVRYFGTASTFPCG